MANVVNNRSVLGYLQGDKPILERRTWHSRTRDVSLDHVGVLASDVLRLMEVPNRDWSVKFVNERTNSLGLISITALAGANMKDSDVVKIVPLIYRLAKERLARGGDVVTEDVKRRADVVDALLERVKTPYGASSALADWARVSAQAVDAVSVLREIATDVKLHNLPAEVVTGVMSAYGDASATMATLEGIARATTASNIAPAKKRADEVAAMPQAERDDIAGKLQKAVKQGWIFSYSPDLSTKIDEPARVVEEWGRYGVLYAGTSVTDPFYRPVHDLGDISAIANIAAGT